MTTFSTKRVAKNTVILYVRMIFLMLITLYTSRVILSTLGVEDYGVYNVVGGLVSLFGILSTSLSTAISRFITFSLGKGDKEELQRIYSTSIIIEITLAVLIGLLVEVIGVWYLYNKMVIPDGRMTAAFWVLQCTVLTFGLSLISVPFTAEIMAHERMNVFAYFSILEAVLALLNVFLLRMISFDKLILYAILTVLASVFMRIVSAMYCRRQFEECRFKPIFEKSLLKEMGGFAGWNLLGQATWVLNTQGIDLLVNSFFGIAMNAARGIAVQVDNAVNKFTGSLMSAINPQIIKTYAEGDLSAMHTLLYRGAKLAMFLTSLFAIPVLLEAPYLMDLWLVTVPDHAVLFARLAIICTLARQLGQTLVTAQLATGKIRRYQIIVSFFAVWVFPVTWLAYRLGLAVEWCYYVFFLVYFFLDFLRIYLVKDLINLPVKDYLIQVFLRVFIVIAISLPVPWLLHHLLSEGLLRLIVVLFASTLALGLSAYFAGMDSNEKVAFGAYLKQWLHPSRGR